MCSVSGAENLKPTITYLWMKNGGSGQTQVGTNSNTLSFTPLQFSDAANYVCEVNVASSYLTGNIAVMDSLNFRIQSMSSHQILAMVLIFNNNFL